ncbi:MAG TPA: DMT family transporter [Candidatus Eisenbacteria bacterium]
MNPSRAPSRIVERRRAEMILFLMVAAWGLTFPAIKVAVQDVSPGLFMALRFGLVLVFLAAIGQGRYSRNLRPAWRDGLVLGLLLWGSYIFQAVGLKYTTATRSGFITGLSVLIVPLIHAPLRRRLPSLRTLAAILLSLAGLWLLTRPDLGAPNLGDILTLGTAVSYALYVVLMEGNAGEERRNALIGWQVLVMAAASILVMPILDGGLPGGPGTRYLTMSVSHIMASPNLLIGLVVTVPVAIFSVVAITQLQRHTTAVRAGVLYSAEPLFAALFAALWLGERLDPLGLVGGGLILAGIVLAATEPD